MFEGRGQKERSFASHIFYVTSFKLDESLYI